MDTRVCCGAPKSQEELLCPQGPGVRPGLGWAVRVVAGTYPVQGDVGDLETQNDDPDESQDEGLVSIHDVLWPNERYWHLQAQLAGFSCEAYVPEKTEYPKVGGFCCQIGRSWNLSCPRRSPRKEEAGHNATQVKTF